MLELKVSH